MADFRYYAGMTLDDYLQHHGILGMIWGKRNGPPYPLDSEDHSVREKKAGWRKSLDGNGQSTSKSNSQVNSDRQSGKKGLTDGQKKALKTAAVIAAGALAAYGAYKLYQHRDLINLGKMASKGGGIDARPTGPTGPVLGIHNNPYNSAETKLFNKITGEESNEESISAVNPHFDDGVGYKMNCGNCALAMELRRRGYDVESIENPTGMTIKDMTKLLKNVKSSDVCRPSFTSKDIGDVNVFDTAAHGKRVKELIESSLLKQYPPESRGTLFIPSALGSHWVSWEIDASGKFSLINSQNPNFDLEKDFLWMFNYDTSNIDTRLTAIRLDNMDFEDAIKDFVKARS